jgi:hypothetical protein
VLEFSNHGGLVMPLLLQLDFEGQESEMMRIPAEIWRRNAKTVKKLIVTDRELKGVVVDPHWETADVDMENNHYPRRIIPSRIEIFKTPEREGLEQRDIMQDIKTELKKEDETKQAEKQQ